MRFLLVGLVALTATVASAQTGTRSTSLYAEALGPTGAYALGAEQAILTSRGGDRQLRLRAGVSYWSESPFFIDGPTDRVLTVPLGAAALFSLGRPIGLPTAFEFGGGSVIVRRESERFQQSSGGMRLTAPLYAEAAIRASLGTRFGVRGGVAFGGEDSELAGNGARPVLGIGVGL